LDDARIVADQYCDALVAVQHLLEEVLVGCSMLIGRMEIQSKASF
jgi:hypothetical protein